MARDESSREDLLREATALVERVELRITGSDTVSCDSVDHIVVGFRANGSASFFFGEDPVYQFNSAGELRRAYVDGLLFKAARGRLVSIERKRQPNEVQLLSRHLTDTEQVEFADKMRGRLRELADSLRKGQFAVIGQVPAAADVLSRVRNWLAAHDGMPIAATPGAV
jgi:hypothetical protein